MNFQERIEKARLNQGKPEASNNKDLEESFNSDFFGVENIRNSLPCVDLRLPDGSRNALPYSYIMELNYDSTGIEIITTLKIIKITGRDLDRLYDYLLAYRVRYIQSNIGTDANEEGLFVKEISITNI